jgi:hypothetical protein
MGSEYSPNADYTAQVALPLNDEAIPICEQQCNSAENCQSLSLVQDFSQLFDACYLYSIPSMTLLSLR